MAKKKIVIGTRKSALALWQAEHVMECLRHAHPDIDITLKKVVTRGDKVLDTPLAKIGGKGLFTKELEQEMLDGRIDMAVHSLKDVPSEIPDGLSISAVTAREDSGDAVVSPTYRTLADLPNGARVGTSSLRRRAQLLHARPDLEIVDIRGNVETRLKKLETEGLDAVILAVAGLKRLGFEDRITEVLDTSVCLPAVGQGVLAIETREDDDEVKDLVHCLADSESFTQALAERGFLRRVEGGCQVPVGVHATLDDGMVSVEGVIASVDGARMYRDSVTGPFDKAAELGARLADKLLDAGGLEIMHELGLLMDRKSMKCGKVWLVGAGPGDMGLLTLKAAECLKKADIVVYDYLVDKRILRLARPDATFIYVGKKAGHHTMHQYDISQLLVDKAKAGYTVVRLKGGDPFVFGRGGEEGMLLFDSGVDYEIVPGVTSAIAVPAYAGIPVTHRAVATSFAVVTGHEDPSKPESQMRWKQLATATDTIVFLMGVENISSITKKLIEYGRPADTPAALIRWGTRPEQETLVTTVGSAAADVERTHFMPPAIFIVGNVVKLRDQLRWFDKLDQRPLFGKRVLVTRTRTQASSLSDKLEHLGARAIETPVIRLEEPSDSYKAADESIAHAADYDWIIFTSPNGVQHFFARVHHAGRDLRCLSGARFAVIGKATADSLLKHGIRADVVPKEFCAEGLLDAMRSHVRGQKVLIARAEKAREVLPDGLRTAGAVVDVVPAYRTVAADPAESGLLDALDEGVDAITFTSSSTVLNFVKAVGDISLVGSAKCFAIGPVTAKTMEENGIKPAGIARTYTIDGLIDVISERLGESIES